MFTVPDNQPLEKMTESKTGLASFREQLPGSVYGEAVSVETVMVKVEPNAQDIQIVSQTGTDSGSGASDQSRLWTSGTEKSSDATDQTVCVLKHDVKHLSPEQPGYTSPINNLPFLDAKEKEEMMHGDHYSLMGMQSRSSDLTLAPELQDGHVIQVVAVNDYSPVIDSTQEVGVFEFNMTASGNHEGSRGGDATRRKCFICSNCGQRFDSFSLFQRHQCKDNRAVLHL